MVSWGSEGLKFRVWTSESCLGDGTVGTSYISEAINCVRA